MTAGKAGVPVLEARGLSYGYLHGPSVLTQWSARFDAGSMTALTGPSGRGKSTLLYLLGLMLRPSDGAVMLDGDVASSLRDSHRARLRAHQFGFVFQDAALDSGRSVLDNVTEAALYRGESRGSLRAAALELLEKFEVGVAPERKPGQVSGGQAQRIAMCRALLHSPRVLLADEPTGNLDTVTSDLVVTTLREHAERGGVVILVTHSADVAAACDREIVL